MSTVSSSSNYHKVKSVEEFKSLMEADLERISVLSFWEAWAAPCEQMNKVVEELAKKYDRIQVLSIEVESLEDVAESFDVESVPTIVLLKGHTLLTRISGGDATALTAAVEKHSRKAPEALTKTDLPPQAPPKEINDSATKGTPAPQPAAEKQESEEELTARCKKLMDQSKVVLFMKVEPDAPRCGFSRQTVAILREQNVEFTHFDILKDDAVRQGMKKVNDWPTFPQLIVNGEFLGGLDVLKESIENGEFEAVKAGL